MIWLIIITLSIIHLGVCNYHILTNLFRQNRRYTDLQNFDTGDDNSIKFFILIPLLNENKLAEICVKRFYQEFIGIENVRLTIITHISDRFTTQAVRDTIHSLVNSNSLKIVHLISEDKSSLKSDMLKFALNFLDLEIKDTDFLSIYDCDSIPDARAVKFISKYLIKNNINGNKPIVFQQSAYYPLKEQRFSLSMIANARNIHSLNYHYTAELTSYFSSENFNFLRMSVHLIGHGEHIRFSALKEAGGFCPPSCDSSLGFALSYRNIPIVPIPIPDISQSPDKISVVYMQGLRWYNGCDLYIREFYKIRPTLRIYGLASLTFLNNLRWFFFPIICLIAVMIIICTRTDTLNFYFVYFFAILALCRHFLIFFAYKQLHEFAKDRINTTTPNLLSWMTQYLLAYGIMRLIWSIPPWQYYILKLFGRKVYITSTPKSSDIF